MPKNPPGAGEQPGQTPDGAGEHRPSLDDPGSSSAAASASGPGNMPGGQRGRDASRDGPGRPIAERKKKYLVAPRTPPIAAGFFSPMTMMAASMGPSLSLSAVQQALQGIGDVDVVDTVGTRSGLGALSMGGAMGEPTDGVVVARMTDQKASELHQRAQGRLLVERDQHLQLLDPMLRRPDLVTSLTPYSGPVTEVEFVVMGKDGAPLADAEVSLFGGLLPSTAVTGANGAARLSLFGEDPRMISGVYVKPRADHWSFYQRDPDISLDQPNLVGLRPFSDWPALQNLPGQNTLGWGARAMQLDKVPAQFRGQGIRIAVIDSGAATSHGNLNRIRAGFDVINKQSDRNTWNSDTLGHGSHCAGVIAATDPAWGIRGFAPEAEIHVCKLFPGGQISQLIDALEYCIENQIDVVNLSLGGSAPSEALERQIMRAKQAGVACIAAAGNSGGPVQYPASSDHVLAVAAIGKLDEFPPDSYHAETIGADIDAQGVFTARFSCFGPQVDVCAPGVAIVSSVPPNNFAAWDGTSMAAPHVTGLAALVLAHHPQFQLLGRNRSPERVERLFQILRLSAQPVAQRDPLRNGYGMPDALAALGLSVSPGQLAANWQVPSAGAFGMVPGMVPGMIPGMVPGMVPGVVAGANGGSQHYPAGMGAQQQAASRAAFPFSVGPGSMRPSGW